MVICHYIEIIWGILFTPNIFYNIYNREKYHLFETINNHIQPLIDIIQDNNRVITTKKGNGKLPLFSGNGERVISTYVTLCL